MDNVKSQFSHALVLSHESFSFLGRPSRAARRNQRDRSKSATSTVRVTVSVNLPMRKRKSNHYESNYFRTNDFISSHRTMKVT